MKFDKILVLNQNMIGDIVLSTPVLKALRDKFPESKIAFLVRKDAAALVQGLPFIDEVICYKKGDSLLKTIRKIWRYDVALCLDFKYRSAVLPFFAAIPVRAGLSHKRKLFLSHFIARDDKESEETYEPQNMANTIERTIGLKLDIDPHTLYVAPARVIDIKKADELLSGLVKNRMKIAIAPWASNDSKSWGFANYCELMESLNKNYLVDFVILGMVRDKVKGEFKKANVYDLRGKTTLAEMTEVLRRVDLFIGGCSAPLHIAAAVGVPSIALYGATSPTHWAPKKTTVIYHQVACSPCDQYGCACNGQYHCMKKLVVDEVYEKIENLICNFSKNSD
jgi:lipopolysaccharide heptosyltransferase II